MSLGKALHSPPTAAHELFVPERRGQPPAERDSVGKTRGRIPGYRGHIRGGQHYYGISAGEVSRRAPTFNFRPTEQGDPHSRDGPSITGAGHHAEAKRVLGYAGFLPGRKDRLGESFSRTAEACVAEHHATTSPSKHRILGTSTTEMFSGNRSVVLDRDEERYREGKGLEKKMALLQETSSLPGYTGCIRGAQHFFGSTFARVTNEAKTIYPETGVDNGVDSSTLPRDRMAGYRGHLPGYSDHFGVSAGRVCGDCLDEFAAGVVEKVHNWRDDVLPYASPIKRA